MLMLSSSSCVNDKNKKNAVIDLNDQAALDDSIRTNLCGIYRFVFSKVRDVDIAAEIAQETYVRLLAKYGPASLTEKPSLLVTIAHNLVKDWYRDTKRSTRATSIPFDDVDAQLVDPVSNETAEAKYNAVLLKQAIFDLPPRCREVFFLHRFEGMTYVEIAEACGISRETVKTLITRAMRALNKHSVD